MEKCSNSIFLQIVIFVGLRSLLLEDMKGFCVTVDVTINLLMVCDRLVEQLKSARSQLDTLNDEKEHLQERHQIIVEQTRRDLAVKHAECQEYKAKVRHRLID